MKQVRTGNQRTVSVTITRPANTTGYTALDAINPATKSVSGATNATPIVITTSTAHGLSDGDAVTIASVGGNTNANGTYWVDVLSTTTFALYTDRALGTARAGNANYTSGGTVQPIPRLANFFSDNGRMGYITKVRVQAGLQTFLDQLRVYFFNTPVAAIADNSPFTLLKANFAYRPGYVNLPALATEGTGSDCSEATATPGSGRVPLAVQAAADNLDLYVYLLDEGGGGTPGSGMVFTVEATLEEA